MGSHNSAKIQRCEESAAQKRHRFACHITLARTNCPWPYRPAAQQLNALSMQHLEDHEGGAFGKAAPADGDPAGCIKTDDAKD